MFQSVLPVCGICVFILKFCPVRFHKSAWTQHDATYGVDINTITTATFEQRARRGEFWDVTLWSNVHVPFWSDSVSQTTSKPGTFNLCYMTKIVESGLLSNIRPFFVFFLFSCWLSMFPPVLITTSHLFVTEQIQQTLWWRNRAEALLRNKTFYWYFVRSHLLWRTCRLT